MPASDHHRLRERLDAALGADPAGRGGARPAEAPPPLGDAARERLVAFVELLAKWNGVWNLTAVREPSDMLDRHVLDALTLLPLVDAELAAGPGAAGPPDAVGGARPDASASPVAESPRFDLIDVGSGAGLPVLVLAIARPALACLSVERTSKKARFQRQACLELGLDAVTVADARVESVRARASIVTSRAFAAPADFLSLAAPLAPPGAAALVMLGRAERLPRALPGGWTHERTVDTSSAAAGSPERHVALCRRDRIPYDPAP